MFTDLAPELKLGICRFLPPGALPRFSETSKELYELINLDPFCQRKFLHDFAVDATLLGESHYKKFINLTEIAIAQVKNSDFMGARRTFVLANKILESSYDQDFRFREKEKESSKLHVIKIITTLIKAGDRACIVDPEVDGSISVEDHYFRSMIFKELSRSSIEVGNVTEANEFFTLSKNTALLIKDKPDTSYKDLALKKIITVQVKAAITLTKAGRIIEANELFVLSKNSLLQVGLSAYKCELLRKIAKALAITGHEEDVDEFFTLAKGEALLIQSHSCRSLELAKIATVLSKIGQKKQSDNFFTLSKDAALLVQSDNSQTLPLQFVVQHQLQAGNIEEAKATSLLIGQGSRNSSTMLKKVVKAQIKAATAFAKAGQKGAADKFYQLQVDTIEQIKTINLSKNDFAHLSTILKGIVKAQIKAATDLAKADQKEEADKFYQLQASTIEEVKAILQRTNLREHVFKSLSKALKEIVRVQVKAATALTKADQKEEADKFFTLSKDTASSIIGDHNKSLALAKIAAALVETDQEEARMLCTLLKKTTFSVKSSNYNNNYKKYLALTKIIPILEKIGQKKEIEEIFTSLEDIIIPGIETCSYKSKALTKLAVALAKTGNIEKANQLFRSSRYTASLMDWNAESSALNKNIAAQTKIAIALAKSGNIARVKDLIGNARKMNLSGIHVASIALKATQEININKTS